MNIALTTSNLFTQSIIDNSHAMVYVADLEGKLKLVNKQFAAIFQRDKSEIVEKNREQIMPLAVAKEHRANDIKVIQSKKAITIEEANMEKDGEHFYISQKFPLFDINGDINGVGGISTDVTEKNKIKEALAKSEYKYKSLFENSADGIIVFNQDSEILELNAKICEILGYTKDELAAFKGFAIIHPDDLAAKDHNAALDILQEGNSILSQYRLQRKDGTFIFTELNTKMIGENQFLNIIRDITERKNAEKIIQESEIKYRSFFENSIDPMLLTYSDGQILSANAAACELFGYTAIEFQQLDRAAITDFTDVRLPELLATRQEKGKVRTAITLLKKGGIPFETEVSSAEFKNADNVKFTSVIIRDVTEREQAQKRIHESEVKYRAFFENSMDAMLLTNTNGKILSANPAACTMFQCTEQEIIALGRSGLTDATDPRLLEIISKRQKDKKASGELTMLRKDGTPFEVEISSAIFENADRVTFTSLTIRDITERKEAEKALLEREKILSVIFNNHTDLQLLVSIDPECDFRVDAINKPYIDTGKAFGLLIDPKALIGQPIRVLNEAVGLDEEYYNNTIATYNKVISSGKPIYFTETISLSGQNYTSEITLSPIMDEQGKCQYILYNSHNITEQTKATNALFESEEKFKLIFRTSPDFVTINRLEDGEYVDVNDSFIQTSGYAREEIIGKTSKDLNIWSNSKDREIMISKLLETGKVENLEAQFTLKNGKIIDGLLSAALIVINQKQHLLTITRDITELKQAEQAFKETAANLSSMINNREDSIWSIDLDFNYIIFNSTYEKIINDQYSIQLKRGMSSTEKLTKDELNFWKPKFVAVFNGESVSFEFAHIINKELRYFHTSLHPIIEGHKITGASGLSIDVTKRKLIEEALKLSEEKFAKSFRLSPFLITLSSFEGEVIEVNDRIYSTLGYTREEFIGNNTTQLPLWVKPQERENFGLLLQKDHTLNEMEVQFRKKSGEIGDYFISACIIEVHGRPLYLTIVHDITQRKNAEKQIIELNTQLELKVQQRTAQLEAINKELETFSYSVSHDLKAPLRGIDGYSKLLLDIYRSDLKEEAQSFIDKIRRSTLQMNEIIDDLLDYSRLERSQLTISKLNVIDLINSVLSVHSFERNTGTIIFDPKEDNVTINADANGFIMAFRNLVENAIKFTKGQEHPIITIEIKDNNESWIVSVTDNGIGFDMQYHHKIFDIFQRLQRAEDYPGTGIGLALVNKAMQRMHGKTWAESSPNKGATFYLEIPKNQ